MRLHFSGTIELFNIDKADILKTLKPLKHHNIGVTVAKPLTTDSFSFTPQKALNATIIYDDPSGKNFTVAQEAGMPMVVYKENNQPYWSFENSLKDAITELFPKGKSSIAS